MLVEFHSFTLPLLDLASSQRHSRLRSELFSVTGIRKTLFTSPPFLCATTFSRAASSARPTRGRGRRDRSPRDRRGSVRRDGLLLEVRPPRTPATAASVADRPIDESGLRFLFLRPLPRPEAIERSLSSAFPRRPRARRDVHRFLARTEPTQHAAQHAQAEGRETSAHPGG